MKKLLSILLVLTMLLLSLAACAEQDGENNGGETSESETTLPKDYTDVVAGGKSDYTVVMAESGTSAAKEQSVAVVNAIETATGVKLNRVSDNTAKYSATTNEILVGPVNRDESKAAQAALTDVGYSITYTNGKIVLAASNDYMLSKAVEALTTTYLELSDGGLRCDRNAKVSVNGSDQMVSFLDEKGESRFRVVYAYEVDIELADSVCKGLKTQLELAKKPSPKPDTVAKEEQGVYEILIGKTNRALSETVYKDLSSTSYSIVFEGTQIAIAGGNETSLEGAVSAFLSDLTAIGQGTYLGDAMIQLDYSKIGGVKGDWFKSVPALNVGTPVGTDDVGDGSYTSVSTGVTEADYNTYLTTLKGQGFKVAESYEIGQNRYTLLYSDLANVYVSYLPTSDYATEPTTSFLNATLSGTVVPTGKGAIRVFMEAADASSYPQKAEGTYTAKSGIEPTLWQINVDAMNSKMNGGMSYVVQLSDGSFVIIDGGYNTELEADNLYKLLKAKSPDAKPRVAAWFISHQHSDHYGGLLATAEKYANDITVDAFYYNFNANDHGYTTGSESMIRNAMKKWRNATLYRKLHSGMSFYVADAEFTVMFTHEDLYPLVTNSQNDTSTVLRMKLDGKTVMFLADIEDAASAVIETFIPASALKSDIVQFAHHGYEGATAKLYDMIEAPTVLWPLNIYGWQTPDGTNVFGNWKTYTATKNQSIANKYICEQASYVKKIIVAGEGIRDVVTGAYVPVGGVTEIVLGTWVPTGNKLPNYAAIHDEIAAKNPRTEEAAK